MNKKLMSESAQSAGTSEAQHRYLNAMQMLSSMTRRELRQATTPEARKSLTYIGELVETFGDLFADRESGRDLSTRISNICQSWQRLCEGRIQIVFETAHDVSNVPQEQIVNTSLIVQELLLNAIKHAFPEDRTGTIRVCLERCAENHATLSVSDDGVGAVPSAEGEGDQSGRCHQGTDIVRSLATAIGGTIQRGSNGGSGHKVSIRWPLSERYRCPTAP